MQHSKLALLLLIAPLLSMAQMVGGQSYATQTVTTVITNTLTSTTMGTSVVSSIAPQSRVIFSAPFTLPATHGEYTSCGIYLMQPFNATAGAIVSGTLNTDNKVDLYILTDAAFQAWSTQIVTGGVCTPASFVLKQQGTVSYNFTSTIPANGLYHIVVNNLSHSIVNAKLTANIEVTEPIMVTSVAYSTMTQLNVQTLSLITLATATPQPALDNTTTLIVGGLVIVVVVAISLVLRAKRGSKVEGSS